MIKLFRKKPDPEQKKALDKYNFRLREEDRYFGSVFVNKYGSDLIQAKTKQAYENCKQLGLDHTNGL